MRVFVGRLLPCPALGLVGLFLAASALAPAPAAAFDPFLRENGDVADGNELLAQNKLADALEKYDAAARALPKEGGVHLDRGLALARSGDKQLDQAMQAFKFATTSDAAPPIRARAFAGLGNAFFKKEDYAAAIDNFKKSLLLAPGNKDVAWNLELAMQKKKQKDEQQKKDQEKKDQENKDKQDQDQQKQDQQKQDQQKQDQQKQDQQKQDQQKQDQQKQDQQKQDQQKQDQQKQDQPKQEEQPQPQPQPKTRQDIEQMLDSLDDQEENLRKNQARQKGAMIPAGQFKDW